MLEKEQQLQEDSYRMPYHWLMNTFNRKGRDYFGYVSICLNLIESYKNKRILDAGCGDGRFLSELKNRGAINLYGIDYSERAVSFAKIFIPEANIQIGDLFSLPYKDGFFDVIFLIEVLEHIQLDKVNSVLKELRRVLKKDGELVVTVPSNLIPVNIKHYQHFSEKYLRETLSPFFNIKKILGQDKSGFSLLKLFYKLLDNRYWLLRPFANKYNLYVWPRFFNKCNANQGNRLIIYCTKNEK